jgi:alkanesulfonate monooxygenase SsuD/methylene tetrahydromethanopterin reductase-like flavin-dependent oxidoreductase (luciferase family)
MITRFGSLFAGHVDLDDHGLDATPVNDRWLSNERLLGVFGKATRIAQLMDRRGYDTFWLAEHHFQREGYEVIPNILMLAVHLAHLTERIKFGCAFNIAPMWHPLRLAEDYAVAEHLTNGRVIFGVGRGYHTREVETFGTPMLDQDLNRELFEEQVEIIFKAFNEPAFSHAGKHYTLPPRVPYRGYELTDLTLVPQPVRRPVECYQPIVSASPRGLDFMAKHGIKGMIGGGAASGGAASPTVLAWQEALRRHGRETELGEDLIIGITFHIADNEEQAIREARPFRRMDEDVRAAGFRARIVGRADHRVGRSGSSAQHSIANTPRSSPQRRVDGRSTRAAGGAPARAPGPLPRLARGPRGPGGRHRRARHPRPAGPLRS